MFDETQVTGLLLSAEFGTRFRPSASLPLPPAAPTRELSLWRALAVSLSLSICLTTVLSLVVLSVSLLVRSLREHSSLAFSPRFLSQRSPALTLFLSPSLSRSLWPALTSAPSPSSSRRPHRPLPPSAPVSIPLTVQSCGWPQPVSPATSTHAACQLNVSMSLNGTAGALQLFLGHTRI